MRKRLVGLVAATTSLVIIALMVPMALLVQRFAFEDALAAAALEVQATESVVAFQERADLAEFINRLNRTNDGTRETVLFEDGDAIGPDKDFDANVVEAQESQRAQSNDTDDGVEILVPVSIGGFAASDATAPEAAVIRVIIDQGPITTGVFQSWAILAALGIALFALSVLLADRLARTLLRGVTGLASTAEQLSQGNLEARFHTGGPVEIRAVGQALNRLAARMSELLAAERESAADLSHRLRTPLMALRLESEELRDSDERRQVCEAVDSLAHSIDALIIEARRPVREGVGAQCDAAVVVEDRTAFWMVLADDQRRVATIHVEAGPLMVKLPKADLEAAVDALLENVFAHTDEGTGFSVSLRRIAGGGAELVVSDEGPGISGDSPSRGISRSGSTGLGLDIIRRTAEASGGSFLVGASGSGGAMIRLTFGPPDEVQR